MRKKLLLIFLLLSSFALAQDVTLSGNITSNMTLTNDKAYLLHDLVRVMSGATLTIDPGTIIYGENSSEGSLIIEPGAKIMAEGTVSQPIVFTSEFAKPGSSTPPERGDWGGVILLGNAPVNIPGGVGSIEGPGDSFGGNDPHDNSGVLKYVRIEYAGVAYSPNNEINALTFGGIGDGTTIEYVEAAYSNDDSYEWFGGTVHVKHMIAYRGIDDDFDTDNGFQGKLQFLLGVRDPQVADVVSGSNGFESDNDADGSLNTPRTGPEYWNVTLIGPQPTTTSDYSSDFKRGMHLRRSSQNKVNNALILGWPTGILIDGVNTSADAENNVTYVKNSIIAGSSKKALDTTSTNGSLDISAWFSNNSSQIMDNTSDVMLESPFDINNPNCMPMAGSPVLSGAGTPPDDGFFDPAATYIGAFKDVDWTFGWARFNPEVTGVKETRLNNVAPQNFMLSQNYPNPFNPTTKIQYSITKASNVRLAVYNILGQEVSVLVNRYKGVGTYEVDFDASNLASGIYIYRIEAGDQVVSKKMTLLK
jgi:Secretion system C-terminal sorting domain